jgi:glycosyltransferase involved in cell wall biosynthesis
MKLLAVADRIDSTIAEIRLGEPLRALAAQTGWTLALRSSLDVEDTDLQNADVLVLQRGVNRRALGLIERMRASGGHAVYEIDDLLTEPAPHLQNHPQALRNVPWVLRCLAAASAVSASTARLADALRPHATRVQVVPNCGWPGALAVPQAPRDASGPLQVLLASSDHLAGEALAEALERLAAARPGRVQVVAIGPAALALAGRVLPLRVLPLMPRPDFAAFVAGLPHAVAAIPLGDTRFDACKSAIKYFDYALLGLPVLCSNVPPYSDVVHHGVDGALVGPRADDWYRALLAVVDDPRPAQGWALAAAAQVRAGYSQTQTVAAWRALIDELGPRRAPARRPAVWQQWWQATVRRLQRANRARLARRNAQRKASTR